MQIDNYWWVVSNFEIQSTVGKLSDKGTLQILAIASLVVAFASPMSALASPPDRPFKKAALDSRSPHCSYPAKGKNHGPPQTARRLCERGQASWYGKKFHGRRTASGEIFDMHAMTAAHKTLPLRSYARVRNLANGRAVIVRVNDRGPFHAGRVIDLSYAAAVKLGLRRGTAHVEIERITPQEISPSTGASQITPKFDSDIDLPFFHQGAN